MAAPTGYPKIPTKAWQELRSRAAAAPSTKMTPSSVAALLKLSGAESAQTNIVSPLKKLGLINEEGGLTDRGNKWRIDASYAEACQEIIDEVYPEDLAQLTRGDGSPDPQSVKTWFDHKGFGASNASQMAATYLLIARKDISSPAATESKKAGLKSGVSVGRTPRHGSGHPRNSSGAGTSPKIIDPAVPAKLTGGPSDSPNVHLDIQIHIPADASLDQIERIFESMAKHLYRQ